jgi:hypothetical protein
VIYKVDKELIPDEGEAYIDAELIEFSYAEQKDFLYTPYRTKFDCEAMAFRNDSLFLFTKNWINENTMVYRLPLEPGSYEVEAIDTFDCDGLITGAEFLEDPEMLVLSGYKNFYPFMWQVTGLDDTGLFNGTQQRFNFNEIFRVQTEGIVPVSADSVFISSETTDLPASIYLVKLPASR